MHGGSSVESGFESATLRSRGRGLATRPPRPPFYISDTRISSILYIRYTDIRNTQTRNTSTHAAGTNRCVHPRQKIKFHPLLPNLLNKAYKVRSTVNHVRPEDFLNENGTKRERAKARKLCDGCGWGKKKPHRDNFLTHTLVSVEPYLST
ncbi:hypothetical protein AVEN_35489-1 [Araneus ventricosus]|uniref:Uncharacterized protein n=1 Tax=Araneus ventricosus TaxID=182803 RepID=A0A4Y2RE00_ARAVE|nr:hypothetical protein AVEN_35489-1 [Araneus ventricosus]